MKGKEEWLEEFIFQGVNEFHHDDGPEMGLSRQMQCITMWYRWGHSWIE